MSPRARNTALCGLVLALHFAAPGEAGAQSTEQSPALSSTPDSAGTTHVEASAGTTDLEQAADATAEVASLAVSTAPTGAVVEDVDLAKLGLANGQAADSEVQLYGFASANYFNVLSADRQVVNQFAPKEGSFFVGDLNLYLSKNLSASWRTLLELRVTYAPNGRVLADGTIESNQSYDMSNLGRPVSWGGVNIERAYVEYDVCSWLTVRAGSYLTPYGIWNVDHGMPVIIPIFRPYVMNEQIFPERQSGVQILGKVLMGRYALAYDLTASNGRGSFAQFRDLDETKAFGGRIQLETPWLGGLRLGASIYHGRFVDRASDYTRPNEDTMDVDNITPRGTRYDELAYAFDLLHEWRGFRLQAEVVGHEFAYLAGARAADAGGFRPDGFSVGGYLLAGYRFPHLWNVMPFALYQRYQKEESSQAAIFSALENYSVGLNFRPIPTLVLKAQFSQSWIPGGKAPVDDERLDSLGAQVTWVF